METYRLFLAVELPTAVKQALVAAQERLRRDGLPVKWVAPEAMHLTLHFLGETDVEMLPRLSEALPRALNQHSPFELQLTSAGAFPNLRRPNVVWAGLGRATAALERAQAALGSALESLGLPRETRPFHAHLTLGRVRREATPAEQSRLGEAVRALPPFVPTPWVVERVVLFRSQLRREGPLYTELAAAPLG